MESIINVSYIINGIMAFIGVLYLGIVVYQKMKKKRTILFTKENILNYFLGFLVLAPILAVLYIIPIVFYDPNFWLEGTSQYIEARKGIYSFGVGVLCFYAVLRASIFMPHENEYYNITPKLLFLSLFPGVASAINVMIISKFLTNDYDAKYFLLFFLINTFIYVITTRISKRETVNLGILTAHKFNLLIIDKIFKTPYRKQEEVKEGKMYTILNDDIRTIFSFSQDIILTYTNLITLIVVQVYLFTIDWASSLALLGIIVFVMGFLAILVPRLNKTGNIAREKREEYSEFISGLIKGFKELVLHKVKIGKYKKDMEESSKVSYSASQDYANVGIDANVFSELSFTIAMGASCLVFPLIFNLDKQIITAYVLVVLFLMGPVTIILNGLPQVVRLKVSLDRIKAFIKDAEIEDETSNELIDRNVVPFVTSIEVKDVSFTYDNEDESMNYGIGPINFKANKGELVFIIGGNGSGKTTFLKLLTGLYKPNSGNILINDMETSRKMLGECFSVIYSDSYLFKKLYDLKEDRLNQVNEWLDVLQLSDKVTIENGVFSTIALSKGQRKRLSILKSYLEDRPVYFFDEVAADLDPEFRDFFYNDLLVKLREEGKILIIISHDDKYFSLADSIYKMDMGQLSHQTIDTLVLFE